MVFFSFQNEFSRKISNFCKIIFLTKTTLSFFPFRKRKNLYTKWVWSNCLSRTVPVLGGFLEWGTDTCWLSIWVLYPLSHWFSKYSKNRFWYITMVLQKKEKVKEPASKLPVLSSQPLVLLGLWNNWNWQFFDSVFSKTQNQHSSLKIQRSNQLWTVLNLGVHSNFTIVETLPQKKIQLLR
jgi:hypothetical protein